MAEQGVPDRPARGPLVRVGEEVGPVRADRTRPGEREREVDGQCGRCEDTGDQGGRAPAALGQAEGDDDREHTIGRTGPGSESRGRGESVPRPLEKKQGDDEQADPEQIPVQRPLQGERRGGCESHGLAPLDPAHRPGCDQSQTEQQAG